MATQLIVPNPRIQCTPGLCLVFVRETFSIGPKYPTASEAWQASTRKHIDAEFPDAWVPVWFSLDDEPAGHVALREPDGTIWSSSHPSATEPVHHESLMDIENYYRGRLHYLGWTEDIEDVAVVSLGGVVSASGIGELRAIPIGGPVVELTVPPKVEERFKSIEIQ